MQKMLNLKNYIILSIALIVIYLCFGLKSGIGFSGESQNASNCEKLSSATFEVLVSCTGAISAISSVEVKARVAGNVEYLKLKEGDYVKKGDLVATIDKRNIILKVKQTEADLRSSKAQYEEMKLSYDINKKNYNIEMQKARTNIELSRVNLAQMKKGSRPEEISQGSAQLDLAGANYENSRKSYERQKELFTKNLVSQASLDEARANLDVQSAQLKTAREKLSLLKQGYQSEDIQKAMLQYEVAIYALEDAKIKIESLNMMEQKILNLKSMVDKSESIYQDALEQLNDTTVLAPISGIVTEKNVDEGGVISSGISSMNSGTSIITLSDMNEVWVKAYVDETDISKLKNDLQARVRLDCFPKRTFAAQLICIGPRVYLKNDVPSIDITLRLLEGTGEVKVGMTANADIVVSSKPQVKMIPFDSIIEKEDKKYVKIAMHNGLSCQPYLKEISVGESNGEKIILLDGLDENDYFYSGIGLKLEKASQTAKTDSGFGGPPPGPPPM